MSSSKRRNENAQIQKEDYDKTIENSIEEDAGSFQRANEATLKNRRIIQLRKPIAPPPEYEDKPKHKPKQNAFAGITLQVSSGSAALTQATPAAVAFANQDDSCYKKSLQLFDACKTQVMTAPLNPSWLDFMMQYVNYHNELCAEFRRSAPPAVTAPAANAAAAAAAGAPKAAPLAVPLSFGTTSVSKATAPVDRGFSFVAPRPSAAPASTTAGFSFAAAPVAAVAVPPANKNNDDDTVPTNDDGDTRVLPGQRDEDWIEIQTFEPVQMFRHKDPHDSESGWSKFCSGKLIFQQDRKNASVTRMLMRDQAGIKVHVNMSLRGLTFTRSDSKNQKTNQPVARIVFRATNDATRGPENFVMRPTMADADALEQKMRELTQ